MMLLEGLITMCGRLGKTIVVEGVQEQFQLALLRANAIPVLAQGYLLGRPAAADLAAAHITGRRPRLAQAV